MSRHTALHKRSSNRRAFRLALAAFSMIPFAAPVHAQSLFANPMASDQAFAPVEGIGSKKNQLQQKNANEQNMAETNKRQNRSGDVGIFESMRSNISNTANTLNGQIDATKADLANTANQLSGSIAQTNSRFATESARTAEAIRASTADAVAAVSGMISSSEQEVLAAVAIALGNNPPQTFEFTTPQALTQVTTMPYLGTVVMTIVGGGAGGNAGYETTPGFGGNAGQVVYQRRVDNIPQGTPISVAVGSGGLGASTTAQTPGSGQPSQVRIGGTNHTALGASGVRQFGCQPATSTSIGHVGLFYRTNNPGDGGAACSGGFGHRAMSGDFNKSKSGTGGGALVGDYYWRSGTLATLSGQSDARFGGGGGGGAQPSTFVPSRGFYQDPINGDGGRGYYHVPGGAGSGGYVQVRIFDPNEIITMDNLTKFVKGGGASDSNFDIIGQASSKSGPRTKQSLVPAHSNCYHTSSSKQYWCEAFGAGPVTITPDSANKRWVANFAGHKNFFVTEEGRSADGANYRTSVPLYAYSQGDGQCGSVTTSVSYDIAIFPQHDPVQLVFMDYDFTVTRRSSSVRFEQACDGGE